MESPNVYHYGILVSDIDKAIKLYGRLFGLTFHEPTEVHLNRLVDPDEHEFDLRVTYSQQGPPYMELLEAKGDGVYSAGHGEGVHHIGMWDPAIDENKKRYVDSGVEVDGEVLNADGTTFAWYTNPKTTGGVRFEFVDESAREDLEKWIQTGIMGPGGFVV